MTTIPYAITYVLIALWLAALARGIWVMRQYPHAEEHDAEMHEREDSRPSHAASRWVDAAEIRADIQRRTQRRAAAGVCIDFDTRIIRN